MLATRRSVGSLIDPRIVRARRDNQTLRAHLVGGGIASLSAAAFLIRDGHIPGKNIHILEESSRLGGSLDAQGSPEQGYIMRGGRMFTDEAYECTWNLLSSIPSLNRPGKTVREEVLEFNKHVKSHSKCRLVEKGEKVDVSTLGFSRTDRSELIKLLLHSEASLGASRIQDHFSLSFFKTNFWFMWCTTFAFQPWHSAVEFKRYALRFIQEFPRINALAGVRRTPFNQYDSIVSPLVEWLKTKGVRFEMNCQVTKLDFSLPGREKTVERIHYLSEGEQQEIVVDKNDCVFVTLGSMTAGSTYGSMTSAPQLESKASGGSWTLWEKLAEGDPDFGRPSAFDDSVDQSKWESFTITFRDPAFFTLVEQFTGNEPGTGGLITFKDSNWLLSIVLAYQPHFANQPKDISVCWGYGLFPDYPGNFVPKRMSDCTGQEILTELCSHFRFNEYTRRIVATSTCIPCMMPFITSQFLPRRKGDRPPVIPKGSINLAVLGQYCEIANDVVFTVEYSVRSAQMAVYSLLGLKNVVPPIYKGQRDPRILLDSLETMLK